MTTETHNTSCNICSKKASKAVCSACHSKMTQMLASIPALHTEAGNCLEPVSGSHAQGSSERPIGINVAALDFSMANDLLAILWGWESIIRMERKLTAPALLPLLANRHAQVLDTCTFHLVHLEHSVTTSWVKDFFDEITKLHGQGMNAARKTEPKPQRISCPAEHSDGLPCGRMLSLETSDLQSIIFCSGCSTEWSPARLIAVKTADRTRMWWIDIEAAAGFLALSERQIRRIVKSKKVKRKGQLYDLHGLMDSRSA